MDDLKSGTGKIRFTSASFKAIFEFLLLRVLNCSCYMLL